MVGRQSAKLQCTWTGDGAAFWGWDEGGALPGEAVRRLASTTLGSWWAGREASLVPVAIDVPDHDIVHLSALSAPARTVVDLLADRYPSKVWTPSMRWMHGAVSLAIDAAITGLILPALETTGLRWNARWQLIDHPAVEARIARLVDLAEYKRRQTPPGIKITERAFGRDRRMPITKRR